MKKFCFVVVAVILVFGISVAMTTSRASRLQKDEARSPMDLEMASHQSERTVAANSETPALNSEGLPWTRFRGPNETGISTDAGYTSVVLEHENSLIAENRI